MARDFSMAPIIYDTVRLSEAIDKLGRIIETFGSFVDLYNAFSAFKSAQTKLMAIMKLRKTTKLGKIIELRAILQRLKKCLELWEKLFYLAVFYLSLTEFPDGVRHLCTTMPWTIWPALVVLWGVCWMFYEPSDESWENSCFPHPGVEYFGGDEDGYSASDWIAAASLDANTINPEFFAEFEPLDFGIQQQFPTTTAETSSVVAAFSGTIPTGYASKPSGVLSLQAIETQPSTGESRAILTARTTPLFGQQLQVVAIPNRQNHQARNREQKLVCEHPGCESTTFNSKGELQRHNNKSNKTFYCQPCEEAFGSKHDLQRHQRSRHGEAGFFCGELDCVHSQFGSKGGFKRKDHLTQHIRGVHKQSRMRTQRPAQSIARASPVAESSPEAVPTSIAPLSNSKKRKRSEDSTTPASDDLTEELLEEKRKSQRLQSELQHERERHEETKKRENRLLEIIASLSARGGGREL